MSKRDIGGLKFNNKPSADTEAAVEKILDAGAIAAKLQRFLPDLTAEQAQLMGRYHEELMKFNKAVNLISPSTIRTAESVHFADSIMASRIIFAAIKTGEPIYDIGSGNGFPGLVFAALFPSVPVVLVERDSRKGEFLKHIAKSLALKNVSFEPRSLEDLAPGKIVNGMARGFAPLHKGMLMARKQFALGGRFFHIKGDGWATELAGVPSQLFSFWTPSLLGQYKIPDTSSETAIILTEKTGA